MSTGAIGDPWENGSYFSATCVDLYARSSSAQLFLDALTKALLAARPRRFRWAALSAMPPSLVYCLSRIQECKVELCRHRRALETTFWSYYPIFNVQQATRLNRSRPNLITLDLIVPTYDTALLELFGKLIVSTTHLNSMRIYALGRLWRSSDTPTSPRGRYHAFFKPIGSLKWLTDALSRFGRRLQLKCLELDNFCMCEQPHYIGLDPSLSFVTDVTKLEELSISCFSLVAGAGCITQLQQFRLLCPLSGAPDMEQFCSRHWSEDEVRRFLLGCTRLERLKLLNDRNILTEAIMEHLGSSLSELRTYSTSFVSNRFPWNNISPQLRHYTISGLRHCTRLRILEMSAPVPHMEAIDLVVRPSIVNLHHLEDLTLYCPSEAEISVTQGAPPTLGRTTITCATMPTLWKRVALPSSKLIKLQLVFRYQQPWARDRLIATRNNPLIPERSRTLLAVLKKPSPDANGELNLQISCQELEEARFAERHKYSKPLPGHRTVLQLEKLVTEETTLTCGPFPGCQVVRNCSSARAQLNIAQSSIMRRRT